MSWLDYFFGIVILLTLIFAALLDYWCIKHIVISGKADSYVSCKIELI